jgi:hypothetical protein
MANLRLFELADQPWMPKILRRYFYELLQVQVEAIYQPLLPLLIDWVYSIPKDMAIIDLASGSAGPCESIVSTLRAQGWKGSFTLSDKQVIQYENSQLPFYPSPINITQSHTWPNGAFTLFTALHHLNEPQVATFLGEVVKEKRPIFIAEFTERKLSCILGMLLSPIVVAIDTARLRPFSCRRFLLTYLIPFIPIIYLWDGMVSHLRSYSVDELNEFAEKYSTKEYQLTVINHVDAQRRIRLTGLMGQAIEYR